MSVEEEQHIAHIIDGKVHKLFDHLKGTAELAKHFGQEFGAGEWASLAGLWHDLGKYSGDFQKYIQKSHNTDSHIEPKPRKIDHSTFGAKTACERFGNIGRIVAYIIAGHHAGLPDWQTADSGTASLAQRLNRHIPLVNPPKDLLSVKLPTEKPKKGTDPSMWIRILFSCVVDADFLDTEAFMEPEKSKQRGGYPNLEELLSKFNFYMERKISTADKTPVNLIRDKIYKRCISMAECEPAIFSLTVPTGGGKTLSSMAFALDHAVKYGKKRVIYVIPYTSIVEQTADQFREIFEDSVVEHHSNVEVSEDEDDETFRKSRLASENWDAPVIVTTNVQFLESLYASRPGRCRKLHNIVNSVVVLDEAQLLPPDYLEPVCKVLNELHRNYGVTILLSTATQPALGSRKTSGFKFDGLNINKEIIDDPNWLHEKLKRVSVEIPKNLSEAVKWEDLAKELSGHEKVLCVVNRRDDCRTLYRFMPEGTIHLSALMCGAHRSEAIADIKRRLQDGLPTRVVSTQLVEAGVDLDFPVVYRALSGLDSIAQAAGRCNREGLLREGRVSVFVPPSEPPPGILRQAAEIGRQLLAGGHNDPLSHGLIAQYFKELYWIRGDKLDSEGILKDLDTDSELRFSFRTAAEKFRIIDESRYAPVLVRYGEGSELINVLVKQGPERRLMRKLQRYVVNVPKYVLNRMIENGAVEQPYPNIYAQSERGQYHPILGLMYEDVVMKPDDLIV